MTNDGPRFWQPHDFRLVVGTTRVDYDPVKSNSNRQKHGYDLSCAVDIFDGALLFQTVLVTSEAFTENGEVRHMHLAEYQGRVVLVATTMRDVETVRIISMRDASDTERAIYFRQRLSVCGR